MSEAGFSCPLPNAHRRLSECHRLWHHAAETYDDPEGFRTQLNALLQALRNVTFVLQKEKRSIPEFDAWYEPLRDGMITASASFSTVGSSYWTRAAAGWLFFDHIWLGPEFLASGDYRYRQLRVGGHITSLRLPPYEFSLGAGWATDNDGRSGAYGRVGVLYRPFNAESAKPAPF